jgi:hypothetical protein
LLRHPIIGLPLLIGQPFGFLRGIGEIQKCDHGNVECWKAFDNEKPLPDLQTKILLRSISFQVEQGDRGAVFGEETCGGQSCSLSVERFYRRASPPRGIEEEICGFNPGIYV